MTHAIIFETERLRMRPLRVDDAEALYSGYADVDAMTYWTRAAHRSVDETRANLSDHLGWPDWRAWAITLKGDDRAIGSIKGEDVAIGTLAAGERRQGKVVEIGYMLLRAYWGQGLAREAVSALIDQLFSEGNRRVFADTDPENTASRRLLESLGFKLEGYLREEWETHIGVRDTTLYGLLRHEWTNDPLPA